nr:MAG TPA: hypothetical protein [Caudoviricetes sp.]
MGLLGLFILRARIYENRSPKLKRKCLSLVVFGKRLLAMVLS